MSHGNTGNTARPTQEMINEGYKQVRINARLTALQAATDVLKMTAQTSGATIEDLLSHAQKVENYIMKDIEPPTLPTAPSLVKATRFP